MMQQSKSFQTGQFINTGAPAAIEVEDEITLLVSKVKKMTFRGDNILATSDDIGNVTIDVATQTTVEILDGGNF